MEANTHARQSRGRWALTPAVILALIGMGVALVDVGLSIANTARPWHLPVAAVALLLIWAGYILSYRSRRDETDAGEQP